jgi:hypothetical protein
MEAVCERATFLDLDLATARNSRRCERGAGLRGDSRPARGPAGGSVSGGTFT